MLISNKIHYFRNFYLQNYEIFLTCLAFNRFFIKINKGIGKVNLHFNL